MSTRQAFARKGNPLQRRELLTSLGALFAAPPALRALEEGQPSRTAIVVAVGRAVGARNPDPATRNPDHLAETLLRPEDRELIRGHHAYDVFDMSWSEVNAYFRQRSPLPLEGLPFAPHTLRTRYFDAAVRTALGDGTTQIVILGAGLDSRPYRLTRDWKDGRVFEVDFPPGLELKKARVRSALGDPPENLAYLPIDFTRQTLQQVLPRGGYRPDAKTLFLWEGVTMYLPREAVETTLAFVARHAGPGSSIVFDYFDDVIIKGDHCAPGWRAVAERFAAWGEPWVFGVPTPPPGNIAELTGSQGLRLANDWPMGELARSYFPPTFQPVTLGLARWAWRMCRAERG